MASFHSITIGEQTEFQRVLAGAGLDATDVRRIVKDPTLAESMVRALRERIPAFPSLFVKAGFQWNNVYRFCKDVDWGFIRADIPEPPMVWAPPSSTSVMLLMPYAHPTANESGLMLTYAEIIRSMLPVRSKWTMLNELQRGREGARVLGQPQGYSWKPGVRWVWFDPNAYQGVAPDDARLQAERDGVQLAGLEVLMAMKLFPEWVDSWNGKTSPYPMLSGLQADRSDGLPMVPRFALIDESKVLELRAVWTGLSHPQFASPSIREC